MGREVFSPLTRIRVTLYLPINSPPLFLPTRDFSYYVIRAIITQYKHKREKKHLHMQIPITVRYIRPVCNSIVDKYKRRLFCACNRLQMYIYIILTRLSFFLHCRDRYTSRYCRRRVAPVTAGIRARVLARAVKDPSWKGERDRERA